MRVVNQEKKQFDQLRLRQREQLLKRVQENEEMLIARNNEKLIELQISKKLDFEESKKQRERKKMEMAMKIEDSKRLVKKLKKKRVLIMTKIEPEQLDQ